jgi:hypothetical protein
VSKTRGRSKVVSRYGSRKYDLYTDKKRNKISIYKEIQKGAVAKSNMTYGLLIFD